MDLQGLLTTGLEADRLRLPPYPAVALKLQQLASTGRHTTRDLCATLNADAVLVAAVLRRANSAASAASTVISSLETAVTRIGTEDLLRLALAQSVGVTASSSGPLASLRRDAWRMSLLSARFALELAGRRGIDPDMAFLAGLLHDFGAIAVLGGLEDLKIELPVLPAEIWKDLVDRLHVQFGTVIATRWRLPLPIVHAIQHHHQVADYQGPHRALVELIATVDRIIDIFDRAPTTSIAALLEMPGLSQDERYQIGAMLPKIADFMMSFEGGVSPAREARAPTAVAKPQVSGLADGWPVDLVVTVKQDVYRGCAMSSDAIAFRGELALLPSWLMQIKIGEPGLSMLARVQTCEAATDGSYLMTAQPFGIEKASWLDLIARSRRTS
jgi:HD-like signal output (HDOD) protein